MEIRLVSTLNDEDEEALAAMLGAALSAFLDETSLNYTLRIEANSKRVFHRQNRQSPAERCVNGKGRGWPFLIRP